MYNTREASPNHFSSCLLNQKNNDDDDTELKRKKMNNFFHATFYGNQKKYAYVIFLILKIWLDLKNVEYDKVA